MAGLVPAIHAAPTAQGWKSGAKPIPINDWSMTVRARSPAVRATFLPHNTSIRGSSRQINCRELRRSAFDVDRNADFISYKNKRIVYMNMYLYVVENLNDDKNRILDQINHMILKEVKISDQNHQSNDDKTEEWILELRRRISDIDCAIIEFS